MKKNDHVTITNQNSDVTFTSRDAHLSIGISYTLVEFATLQYEEIVSRLYNAALGGDGASCVHIVTCHHAHCDARLLTFSYGRRYLYMNVVTR